MKILIAGGAGFVGSRLALAFRKADPGYSITVLDNLRRRGSELNLTALSEHGVRFVHGDIRMPSDLNDLEGNFDLFIDASAEPSVHAGVEGSPSYVLETNLTGTLNCLEFSRRRVGGLVFLSTSRVYSIQPLRDIPLTTSPTRFSLAGEALRGVTEQGINEDFPTHLPRSFYGATKLASELVIQEYAQFYDLPAVIDRCGVIAGGGQFGKVDQGVFTLWLVHHYFERPLVYKGFGGHGQQVRDLLHPLDLFDLLRAQIDRLGDYRAEVFNVGGGMENAVSLAELTVQCQNLTGHVVPTSRDEKTSAADIPFYVSDCRKATVDFRWQPARGVEHILRDVLDWVVANESRLAPVLCPE